MKGELGENYSNNWDTQPAHVIMNTEEEVLAGGKYKNKRQKKDRKDSGKPKKPLQLLIRGFARRDYRRACCYMSM